MTTPNKTPKKIRNGLHTEWYENGQKKYEEIYKDGKQDGLFIKWYENGQKRREGTFEDGKKEGFWTRWYENGDKTLEGTYKNGKKISEKEWNEDGSVKE